MDGYELYLDTSALLRLYLEDEHSEEVEEAVDAATEVYTSDLTELEVVVSFARVRHDMRLDDGDLARVLAEFDLDMTRGYRIISYDRNLAKRAGEIAQNQPGLRSYDTLHVASAERANARLLAYDRRLKVAASGVVELYVPKPE